MSAKIKSLFARTPASAEQPTHATESELAVSPTGTLADLDMSAADTKEVGFEAPAASHRSQATRCLFSLYVQGANIEKQASSSTGEVDGIVYPTGPKLFLILMSLLLVKYATLPRATLRGCPLTAARPRSFLVALDQTIVAAAVPVIANDFHALSDVGWVRSLPFPVRALPPDDFAIAVRKRLPRTNLS